MAETTSTLRREGFSKKEELEESFDTLAQKGKEKAEELIGRARQVGESATDMARDAGQRIQAAVEEKPIQTALAALGVGVVIGALLTGFFRRQH